MAIETLKNVNSIGSYKVIDMGKLRELYPDKFNDSGSMDYWWFEKEIRPNNFIYVRHDVNSISFTLQNGPVKENGVNGCEVNTLIKAAIIIIDGLNQKFPCEENSLCILKLADALQHLDDRKKDREFRGVEGYSLR